MKQCPQCGARFETGTYCDQDGTLLVAVAPPRRLGRRVGWILGITVLLLVAVAAVPPFMQRHVRVNTDVVLDDVLLPGGRSLLRPTAEGDMLSSLVEGALGVVQTVSGQADLTLRLRVENSTFLRGSLVAARYALTLGDREVGSGEWISDEPILFAAGQETALELTLRPNSPELLDSALRTAAGQTPAVRVHGRMTIELGLFGRVDVPFEVRRLGVDLERIGGTLEKKR